MAMADYMLCSLCGCKTFYDAELDYDFKRSPETGLWNTGDIMVLCVECARKHELRAVEKEDKNHG